MPALRIDAAVWRLLIQSLRFRGLPRKSPAAGCWRWAHFVGSLQCLSPEIGGAERKELACFLITSLTKFGDRAMPSPELARRRMMYSEIERKSRYLEDIQRTIREFEEMAADLERQVRIEEDRTGVRDRSHFSYSTLAEAAAQRRDNLRQSVQQLREKLAAAVIGYGADSRPGERLPEGGAPDPRRAPARENPAPTTLPRGA